MALEQKLSLKLAQKLVMTPSLQQAIKLLQMTRMELDGVVAQELIENPLLEENDPAQDEDPRAEADKPEAEAEAEPAEDAMSDVDLDAYFNEYAESWERGSSASMHEERQGAPLENTLTREPDLYDHLLWQLHMMEVEPLTREIAELIIGNLDPNGFLVASVEEIQTLGIDAEATAESARDLEELDTSSTDLLAQQVLEALSFGLGEVPEPPPPKEAWAHEVAGVEEGNGSVGEEASAEEEEPPEVVGGYPRAEVEKALALVRGLEPPGVAWNNLQECLLSQLDSRGEPEESLARRMIHETWDLLKRRKFEAIAKSFGLPLSDLRESVELIGGLEPRPGRLFSSEPTYYVEPDVHVVKVSDQYVVQLNDDGMPRLRVSRAYRQMLQKMRLEGKENEAQQYIKEKMRSAVWLIKSLDQRQRTIYKVTESIVRQQRAFLDHGIDHLRPMVLRDVAEDIEMHESTVSRVVSNKYMHTPRGLFPMKFFFHSGIDREYGGDISSLTVKRKIEQLVQGEDNKKPLSDSELMRILNREGIHIARRTVAKYRDELGIASSTDRKKVF